MTAYYTINGTMAAPLTSFSVPPHYIIVHIKVLTKKIKLELGVEPRIFCSIGHTSMRFYRDLNPDCAVQSRES